MQHDIIKPRLRKNKTMQKTKQLTNSNILRAALMLVVVAGVAGGAKITHANQFDQQIRELSHQNATTQGVVSGLQTEATSYQDAIGRLQLQIDGIRAQIANNQAQQAVLQTQITANQATIASKKSDLGATIKAMYIDGDISTIEQLATSKDLSDFVDKEEYRNAVQGQLNAKIKEVAVLQANLQTQKNQADALLKEQRDQNSRLAADQSQQGQMLAYNSGQQAAFTSQISANTSKIAELKRKQAQENIRLFGGGSGGGMIGGGGYPWGNAACIHTGRVDGACPNYDWAVNGAIFNFSLGGYGYRNCTDWVAFRAKVAGDRVPSGLGNAKTWDDRAPSFSTPKVGAAAVSNSGIYGHVMYVEAVHGDGSITISDYNRAGTGKYDTSRLSAGAASNLRYVYFN